MKLMDNSVKWKKIEFDVKNKTAGTLKVNAKKQTFKPMKKFRRRNLYQNVVYYQAKLMFQLSRLSLGMYSVRYTQTKSKKIRLPLFDNIYLKYHAVGDYAKTLSKIKIDTMQYKHRWLWRKSHESRKHWYADFIFDSVPKSGHLDLEFI